MAISGQSLNATRDNIFGTVRLVPNNLLADDVIGEVVWADALGIALDVHMIGEDVLSDSNLRRFYPWEAVSNVDMIRGRA